jgi:hypothetical protein
LKPERWGSLLVQEKYQEEKSCDKINNNNNNNNKGATGTISKSFREYVSNISGNYKVKELEKTAILGTAHILRKVLT